MVDCSLDAEAKQKALLVDEGGLAMFRAWWCLMVRSEAERQELSAACSVSIYKCAEANLVSNAKTREALDDDANHDAQHRGTAVEQLNPLELLHMNKLLSAVLEPLIAGGRVGVVHWGFEGLRSLGRLSTNTVMAVSARPISVIAVMAAV
jgi:hypothetical protein